MISKLLCWLGFQKTTRGEIIVRFYGGEKKLFSGRATARKSVRGRTCYYDNVVVNVGRKFHREGMVDRCTVSILDFPRHEVEIPEMEKFYLSDDIGTVTLVGTENHGAILIIDQA